MKLLNFLRKPAAFIAANWVGLVILLTGVGVIPALAGNARAMSDLDEYADESGRVVLDQFRGTWRRDLPVSIGTLIMALAGIGTAWLAVAEFGVRERVFLVSLVTPIYFVACTFVIAYIRVAAVRSLTMPREDVLLGALELMVTRPARAFLQVPLMLVLTPVWILAPFTLACGLSLPAWLAGSLWGSTTVGRQHEGARARIPRMIGADQG